MSNPYVNSSSGKVKPELLEHVKRVITESETFVEALNKLGLEDRSFVWSGWVPHFESNYAWIRAVADEHKLKTKHVDWSTR